MTEPAVAVPVLPVGDVVRATAWYQRLGFEVRRSYDGYAIVAFDGAEVHLAEMDMPPATETTSDAYLRVADADAVQARWIPLGARDIAPPADQPYGLREFATEDPDGNLWRVGSPIPADHPQHTVEPSDRSDTGMSRPRDAGVSESMADGPLDDGSPGTDDAAWFAIVAGKAACAGCGFRPAPDSWSALEHGTPSGRWPSDRCQISVT